MKRFILISAVSIVLTAVFTWPFITKLTTYYSDNSEYSLQGFILWHNYRSLISGSVLHPSEYVQTPQYYGYPSLLFSENMVVPSLLFSAIYAGTKQLVLSVNLLTFFAFTFTFVSMYYVAFYMTGRALPSLVAASVFAFNSESFSQFPDTMQLLHRYFLPPLFLFMILYLMKPTAKRAVVFGLFYLLNFLSSVYFGVMSSVILALVFWVYLLYLLFRKRLILVWRCLTTLALAGLVASPLLFVMAPYYAYFQKERVTRSISENVHYSARLADWISPDVHNIWYGKWIERFNEQRLPKEQRGFFGWTEHSLYLGFAPTLLALVGMYAASSWFAYRFPRRRKLVAVVVFLWLGFSAMAVFGPYFTGWNGNDGRVKLPYYYLYYAFPPLQSIRVPTRFQFMLLIPFSLFAGIGARTLMGKMKGGAGIAMALFALVLLENIHAFRFTETSSALLYEKNPGVAFLRNAVVLHYPIFTPDVYEDLRYINWTVATQSKMLNGYSGYFPETYIDTMMDIKRADSDSIGPLLKNRGVRYLIIHNSLLRGRPFQTNVASELGKRQAVVYADGEIVILDMDRRFVSP